MRFARFGHPGLGRRLVVSVLAPTALAIGLPCAGAAIADTVGQMQGLRRVLIVAAPAEADARFVAQRHVLDGWTRGAADRDVTRVEIAGTDARGADDTAAALRRRYRLATGAFTIVLIGKDGHVAYRAHVPVSGQSLEAVIDAMPMRRAGQR